MMCGGITQSRLPTDEEKELIQQIKGDVEKQLGTKVNQFNIVAITTQVVAGINYFAKVQLDGDNNYVHIRVYKPLPGQGELQLHSIQKDKKLEDELAYFG